MVKKERGACVVVSGSNSESRSTNHGTSRRKDGNSRGPLPVASKGMAFLEACTRHNTLSGVAAELGISRARATQIAKRLGVRLRVTRAIEIPA